MIEFHDFKKNYGKTEIITDSDFCIPDQCLTFIMGPNGIGKTTLIKCLGGLESHSGSIQVDGHMIDESVRAGMYIIWDHCSFYDNLSGLDNLFILQENSNLKKRQLVELAKPYLTKEILKQRVKTFSYGQRKRLSLILQHILNPEIVIMDEVSNGLDYNTMKQLKKELMRQRENSTVILTGHQFSFYEDIIDNVLVITKGKKIIDVTDEYRSGKGNLEELYERYYGNGTEEE